MLPAIEEDGTATGKQILLYSLGLIPVSLSPTLLGMSGTIYAGGAIVMGIAYCYFGVRLARLGLPMNAPRSKQRARQLLRASVIYLPLLFALMMINVVK
jgi:protoheme IX farnesyltransferase